jgi:hypothetical protein
MHHRLGYDLPERTGFGGLWSAMDEDRVPAPASPAIERHVVARSAGARSPMVRAHLDAFRLALAGLDAGDEDVAA